MKYFNKVGGSLGWMRAGLGVLLLSAALLWQTSHGLRKPQSQRLSPHLRMHPPLLSRGVAVRAASTSLWSADTSIAASDRPSTPPLRPQGLRWVWASVQANRASFLAQSRSRIAGALVVLALCFSRVAGNVARAHGGGESHSTTLRTSTSSLRHSLSKRAGAVRSAFRGRSLAKLELAVWDVGTGTAASGIRRGGGSGGGGGSDARVSSAVKPVVSSNRGSGRRGKDQGVPSTADAAAVILQSGQEEVSAEVQ